MCLFAPVLFAITCVFRALPLWDFVGWLCARWGRAAPGSLAPSQVLLLEGVCTEGSKGSAPPPRCVPPRLISPVTPTPRHPWSELWARLGNSGAGEGSPGAVQVSPPPPLWVLTGLSGSLSARPLSGVGECPCPVSPEAGPGLGAAQSSPAGIKRLCNSDGTTSPSGFQPPRL